MSKIAEYIVLRGESLDELQKKVKEFLMTGYQPFGSLAVVERRAEGMLFFQPVIKFDEPK